MLCNQRRLPVAAFICLLSAIFRYDSGVYGYTPAFGRNDTVGIDQSQTLAVKLLWQTDLANGTTALERSVYQNALSRQLVSRSFVPINAFLATGALVQFDESSPATAANPTRPLSVPWIALISCDSVDNAPLSPTNDVISMARLLGAWTVVLTSSISQTCQITSAYSYLYNYTIDVFVSTSRSTTEAIYAQLQSVPAEARRFNGTLMEASSRNIALEVNNSVNTSLPVTASTTSSAAGASSTAGTRYLVSTIGNLTTTGTVIPATSDNGTTIGTQQQQSTGNSNTGLAMIILYAITGCVTLLFLVVILSGALRAVRHPERYGPRARNIDGTGPSPQSRATGLAKAILDTFPVVKFGRETNANRNNDAEMGARSTHSAPGKDDEVDAEIEHNERVGRVAAEDGTASKIDATAIGAVSTAQIPMTVIAAHGDGDKLVTANEADDAVRGHAQEFSDITLVEEGQGHAKRQSVFSTSTVISATVTDEADKTNSTAEASVAPLALAPAAEIVKPEDNRDPNEVNDSITCPICLLDFEEGEDIRILPCDNRHRFHDECVVPWLLNVSSLCPLCRLDLSKTGDAEEEEEPAPAPVAAEAPIRNFVAEAFMPESIRYLLDPRLGRPGVRDRTNVASTPHPFAIGNISTRMSDGAQASRTLSRVISSDNVNAAEGTPSRSRFLRYVQQQRQRRRGATVSSTEAPATGPGAASSEDVSGSPSTLATPSRTRSRFAPLRRLSSSVTGRSPMQNQP